MNGIMGMIDIARLNMDDRNKIEDCLDKMKLSMQHLQMLVNDVLDMSKIESGKMECREVDYDLRQLLEEIIAEYNLLPPKAESPDTGHQYPAPACDLRSCLSARDSGEPAEQCHKIHTINGYGGTGG